MKLISIKLNGTSRLISEDAVFDPALAHNLMTDNVERYCWFEYDANECGNPADLPFAAASTIIGVKLTPNGIHTHLIAELGDKDLASGKYEPYVNSCGEIEYSVRLSQKEENDLLLWIAHELVGSVPVSFNRNQDTAADKRDELPVTNSTEVSKKMETLWGGAKTDLDNLWNDIKAIFRSPSQG